MTEGKWVTAGALSAAIAVGLGAFAAHGLKGKLPDASLDAFEVGVRYHLVHSLGVILIGILAGRWRSRATTAAGALLLTGIVLFSGGLYVWSLTGIRAVVHIVPVGGVSFLAGWVFLGIAGARQSSPPPG